MPPYASLTNRWPRLSACTLVLALCALTGCASLQALGPGQENTTARARSLSSDPEAAYHFGLYLQQRRKHTLALHEFQKAATAQPMAARAYNAMGISYDALGEYEQAAHCYQAARSHAPDLACVLNNMGVSRLLQQKPKRAAELLRQAVSKHPENTRYRNNLGLSYAHAGQWELARAQFERAHTQKAAYKMVAALCRQAGDLEAGHRYHRLALRAAKKPSPPAAPAVPQAGPTAASMATASKTAAQTATKPRERLFAAAPVYKGVVTPWRERPIATPRPRVTRITPPPGIEVSNGNGVRHMAARVRTYLQGKGRRVLRLTNAEHFGFATTLISHVPGYTEAARSVAEDMPGPQEIREVPRLEREEIKILVRIGRDAIEYDGPQFAAL